MNRVFAAALMLSLLLPSVARANTLLAAMNVQAATTISHAATVRLRRRSNLVTALAFFAEGVVDCEQTKYVLHTLHGRENNPASFRYVVNTLRRNKPLACIGAWGGATAIGYAVGRNFDPTFGYVLDSIEAVNLLSNFGSGAKL